MIARSQQAAADVGNGQAQERDRTAVGRDDCAEHAAADDDELAGALDVKSQVESSVASLKEAIKNQNMADIETYSAAVNKAFEQMYQAQQAAGQQGPQNPYGNGPQGGPQGPQDQGPDEQ